MKALFDQLETKAVCDYFLDTCFILHAIEHNQVKKLTAFCLDHDVGISSFNAEELQHVHHRLNGTVNHHLRDFLKKRLVSLVPVHAHPGNPQQERDYVHHFDPKILQIVKDPSDAVLFVQALQTHAHVLTKDKHHIFTVAAENYAQQFGMKVLKELP